MLPRTLERPWWLLLLLGSLNACSSDHEDPPGTEVDLTIGAGAECAGSIQSIAVSVRNGAATSLSQILERPASAGLPRRIPVRLASNPGAVYSAEATWEFDGSSGKPGPRQRVLFPDGSRGRILLSLACVCRDFPCEEGNNCFELPPGSGKAVCVPEQTCGDGRCGDGESCDSCPADCGQCSAPAGCTAKQGLPCTPGNPCTKGVTACEGGQPSCKSTGQPADKGTPCGPQGATCDGEGSCAPCSPPPGSACELPGDPCNQGVTACEGGASVCKSAGKPADKGTPCGASAACDGKGSCATCLPDLPCDLPESPCAKGATACEGGVSTCKDTGQPAQAGKPCGAGAACDDKGSCAPCLEGGPCALADPCQKGVIQCSPQVACNASGPQPPGAPCGDGMVCGPQGACVACKSGELCAGDNECKEYRLDCSTGAPLCKETGVIFEGKDCDDGLACTTGDKCGVDGVCGGTPYPEGVEKAKQPPDSCYVAIYYCCEQGMTTDHPAPDGYEPCYNGADNDPATTIGCQQNFCRKCQQPDCSDCP